MIGLGTMGQLLLNMADNGFQVTGYDKRCPYAEKTRRRW